MSAIDLLGISESDMRDAVQRCEEARAPESVENLTQRCIDLGIRLSRLEQQYSNLLGKIDTALAIITRTRVRVDRIENAFKEVVTNA